ncbi:MAG TPA: metallophosphoesterase [Fibrobacteria bacterium]|nr:metallophosphoesterase [Fibrobacteria bacterium]
MILFPALGAPAFLEEKSEGDFLHLLLLSKKDLKPAEINERLRFFEDFSDVADFKRKPVQRADGDAEAGVRQVTQASPKSVRFCETADSITCEPIKDLKSELVFEDMDFRGFLNRKSLEFWQESDSVDGVHLSTLYRVKIDVSKVVAIQERRRAGSFFIHWADLGSSHPVGRQGAQEKILYEALKDTKGWFLGEHKFIGDRLWERMVEANGGDAETSLPCLDMNGFRFDSRIPLSHYHPVYVRPRKWIPDPGKKGSWKSGKEPKDAMNLAVISDLHLVAKFQLLKNSRLRVENSEKPIRNLQARDRMSRPVKDLFPEIGGLISESVQVLESHFRAIAGDRSFQAPDALLLVGDLIDFHRESFPDDFRKLEAPLEDEGAVEHGKRIWDAVAVPSDRDFFWSRNALLKKNFQCGVSYLGMFHLVAEFVSQSNKPVFMLPGNHDGYIDPFGISPRVTFDDDPETMEYTKANEGIACDSNMTFLEATTCFGPTYGNKVQNKDFDEDVLEIFYLLFNPFKTWTCKAGVKQPLILLDWGNEEMMFTHMENDQQKVEAGHLPHANRAIPKPQRAMIDAVIRRGSDQATTLVSHFTYACYEPRIPLASQCNLLPSQGDQNVQEFHEDDVQSKEMDTLEGAAQLGAIGAVGGAALGAPAGPAGALVGAGIGLAVGALAGGGLANYAGVNNLIRGKNVRLPNGSNYGTFHHGRSEVFKWIEKGRGNGVAMTISGHAHRAAFYTFEGRKNVTETRKGPRGSETKIDCVDLKVRGWHLEEYTRASEAIAGKCLMVVSDSAGPIPRRNRDNELEGWVASAPPGPGSPSATPSIPI